MCMLGRCRNIVGLRAHGLIIDTALAKCVQIDLSLQFPTLFDISRHLGAHFLNSSLYKSSLAVRVSAALGLDIL